MGLYIKEILSENYAGSLSPVILLHGFCEDHSIWKNILPAFAKRRVFLVDLPGFGQSEAELPSPLSIDWVGDRIYSELMLRQGLSPIVVGHSLGGYVALSLAARHANSLNGICLFHSTAFADTPEKKESRNKVISFVKENGVAAFTDQFVPGLFHSTFRRQNPGKVADVVKLSGNTSAPTLISYTEAMRDRPERLQVLKEFDGQKLVIAGDKDGAVPLEQSLILKEMVGGKSFVLLEGVAHMGMYEQPDQCIKALSTL